MLLSAADSKVKLVALRQAWSQTNQVVEGAVYLLPDREKLAMECLLVRDLCHLLELYCTHLRATSAESPATRSAPARPQPERVLPFYEWPFDPGI